MPTILLCLVVGNYIYKINATKISVWTYGGMAMFSKMDKRRVIVKAFHKNNPSQEILITIDTSNHHPLMDNITKLNYESLKYNPSENNLKYFAEEALEATYLPENDRAAKLTTNTDAIFQTDTQNFIHPTEDISIFKGKNAFAKLIVQVWKLDTRTRKWNVLSEYIKENI